MDIALLFVAASCSAEIITDGLLVSYSFHRSECLAGVFNEGRLLPLERTAPTTCVAGTGVHRDGERPNKTDRDVVSSKNVTDLVAALARSVEEGGLTFELWFERGSQEPSHDRRPLVSISNPDANSLSEIFTDEKAFRLCEHNGGDLFIEYKYDDGETSALVQKDTRRRSSTSTTLDESGSGPYYHVAVVVGDNLDVYVNGSLVHHESEFLGDEKEYRSQLYEDAWDSRFYLQLFSDGISRYYGHVADGTIHALRVYTKPLNATQVRYNYDHAMANSIPVVASMRVATPSKADTLGSPFSTTEYDYAKTTTTTALLPVALNAKDADDGAGHPNQRDADVRAHPMRVFVDEVPRFDGAQLFVPKNSTPLRDGDEVPRDDGQYLVLVRPPLTYNKGEASELEFTFRAMDGVTGETSDDVALVQVSVQAANRPPVAAAGLVDAYAFATTMIPLVGSDVDGDEIVGAIVEALPATAALRRANNDTALEVGDFVSELQVVYMYNNETVIDTVTDHFSFSLVDARGAVGAVTRVNVSVANNIVAEVAPPESVFEETAGLVYLHASDMSDASLDVCCEIGVTSDSVYDPTSGDALGVGDAVVSQRISRKSNNTTSVAVTFVGAGDRFTSPTSRWNETALRAEDAYVVFVAYACDSPTMRSLPARQPVSIVNVADAATLSISPRTFEIYASRLSTAAAPAAAGDDDDDDEYPTLLDLASSARVVVSDVDRDVDALRVDVTSEFGLLSLNPDHLHRADFVSDEYCRSHLFRSWRCKGSGADDSTMTFIATPSDATLLLSGLTYYSRASGVTDRVTITIYDGADDLETGCLLDAQFKTVSRRAACAVATATFVVNVAKHSSVAAARAADATSSSEISWLITIVILVFISCCCGCICVYYRRSRRLARLECIDSREYSYDTMTEIKMPRRRTSLRRPSRAIMMPLRRPSLPRLPSFRASPRLIAKAPPPPPPPPPPVATPEPHPEVSPR